MVAQKYTKDIYDLLSQMQDTEYWYPVMAELLVMTHYHFKPRQVNSLQLSE